MAELSQEQLLLLNNLMYFNTDQEEIYSVEKLALAAKRNTDTTLLCGGMEDDTKHMKEIADAILKDDYLCSLKIEESLYENNVSAKCFYDSDGDATIVIRGTGGSYNAWKDNALGGYETDTKCQKTINDFVVRMDKKYDDITITGHSKGGNLAQYATIKNSDAIDRCVSFDGQGFNDAFCEKYKTEIAENADKITSINAYNDYVNILLNPIAGHIVYLNNDNTEFKDGHSSYWLWSSNSKKDKKDGDGNYIDFVEQDENIKRLKTILDRITEKTEDLPDYMQKELFSIIGSIMGITFDHDLDKKEWEDIKGTLSSFIAALSFYELMDSPLSLDPTTRMIQELVRQLYGLLNLSNGHKNTKNSHKEISGSSRASFSVKPSELSQIAKEMENAYKELFSVSAEIKQVDYELREVEKAIRISSSNVEKTGNNIQKMVNTLTAASKLYVKCEASIERNG